MLFEEKGNIHKHVEVIQDGYLRYLRFGKDGGWQGAFHTKKPNCIIFPYQRAFAALVSSLPSVESFLAFGVGTGTALRSVRAIHPDCRLYGVDIERTVIETAITFFGAPSHEEAHYFVGDGIEFLKKKVHTFDLIFIDAYLKDIIYSSVLEPGFLIDVINSLTQVGIVVFNIIGRFSGLLLHEPFYAVLKELFGHVIIQPVGIPWTEQNGLVVASRSTSIYKCWRKSIWRNSYLLSRERIIQPFRVRQL